MADQPVNEPIALGPELTIPHADGHRQALLSALAALPADATGAPALDLSGVSACDTSGVQLLLAWRASLADRGWPLRVSGASTDVTEALALYGLLDLINLQPPRGPSAGPLPSRPAIPSGDRAAYPPNEGHP